MTTGPRANRRGPRLLALILFLLFLAILGTASYTFVAYRQAAADLVMERSRQVAYLSAARLQDELGKFTRTLESVARTEGIRSPSSGARQAILEREAFRLADFDGGVVLLDQFGQVLATLPPRPELLGADWSGRDLFRRVLSTHGAEVDNALPDPTGSHQVVSMAVPILGEGEGFSGALVGMFRLGEPTVSSLYASIVRLRLGQAGNLYVVDAAGVILYDSNSVFIGQRLASDVMPGLMLQGEAGTIRRKNIHGRELLISYAPIPETPWMLVSEEDWRTLTQSTRPYANLLLGALALGTVVPAAAVGVLVRQRNQEGLALAREEHLARTVQEVHQALVPGGLPLLPGWESIAHRPAQYAAEHRIDDHLLLPDGRLMISLLQVTGGGLEAAMSMVTGRAALRGAAQCGLAPSEALRRANDVLCLEPGTGRRIQALYGILDPQRGEFAYAQAGLEPPLPLPGIEPSVSERSMAALGETFEPEVASGQVAVVEGGLLVLSIGLTEGRSPTGEAFGVQRARAVLAEGGELDAVLASLLQEAQRFGLRPDQELLVVMLRRDRSGRNP